jgi:P27 family predicted phage terminase small subunit
MPIQPDDENTPAPPEDMDGEALLEWWRIVGDLKRVGKLDRADRALITVYVNLWAVHYALAKRVFTEGPIRMWDNGVQAPTTFVKEMYKVSALLSRLLEQLGLTPASRGVKVEEKSDELDF